MLSRERFFSPGRQDECDLEAMPFFSGLIGVLSSVVVPSKVSSLDLMLA